MVCIKWIILKFIRLIWSICALQTAWSFCFVDIMKQLHSTLLSSYLFSPFARCYFNFRFEICSRFKNKILFRIHFGCNSSTFCDLQSCNVLYLKYLKAYDVEMFHFNTDFVNIFTSRVNISHEKICNFIFVLLECPEKFPAFITSNYFIAVIAKDSQRLFQFAELKTTPLRAP